MKQENFQLDNRTLQDLRNQMQELAKSYVPEWQFDQKDPDIGAVLALLFTSQLHGNVERFNQSMERYHTEFVNLMDISLRPAHPASSTVLMDLVPDTVNGLHVPKGTKLLADHEDEKIVFETTYPVYLTNSRLQSAFMTSEERIIPLCGDFPKNDYAGESEENLEEEQTEGAELKPFALFDFTKGGLERQAMLLYHSSMFDVEDETIYCRITGNPKFSERLTAGEFRFLYYTDQGFLPVEHVQVMGSQILLVKELPSRKIEVDDQSYSMLVLEAAEPQKESISFDSLSFSSVGGVRRADYVGNGSTEYEVDKFDLFGDTLALFSECYIGMDSYFAKGGSRVSLRFRADFMEHFVGLTPQQEAEDLRIVKRKPRIVPESVVTYSYAEEISIEYYNGIGWKRLECEKEYRRMFAESAAGHYELTFRCPEDWQETMVGAYQGRMLRFQLLKADNCYYQPCFHRYPQISDLMISYTYEDHFKKPERGIMLYGTERRDFTRELQENRPFVGFAPGNYRDKSLYLGFDKVFDNGPVSLWWDLPQSQPQSRNLRFYYSTSSGFKEMKIVDYTEGLVRSGIMMFLPTPDMSMQEMEGRRLCWIKITDETEGNLAPVPVRRIVLNAVEVRNIETLEPEDFFLDNVTADMSFPLQAEGILDADVWVNEVHDLNVDAMKQLLASQPDRVRVEYNYLGGIDAFYVKWEERDHFAASNPQDRHYVLDRMQGRIRFGDGIHVRIPRNTESVSFTVQVRRCRGSLGNVEAGAISESSTNLMYVQQIQNPEPAYGGSDMESTDRALIRGAGVLSSGGRFVTEEDYVREVQSFSDTIDKVAVVSGIDRDGLLKERMLYIVLLMKDYRVAAGAFHRMRDEIKQHLLQHCELTIAPEELQIEEPIYVELSVDVWAQVMRMEDSFEIQNQMREALSRYLEPLSNEYSRGWEIGTLPRKAQILMRLNALKSKAIIRQVMVTAKYMDGTGTHEVDLDDLIVSPFMVVTSGEHQIHIAKTE